MTRHYEGNSLSELRNFNLVQGKLFKINGKNHYRGVSPYPVIPALGDTWDELDGVDRWVENWVWNGTYWLTQQVFLMGFEMNNISSTFTAYVPGRTRHTNGAFPRNRFLLDFRGNIFVINTLDNSRYWLIELQRRNSNNLTITNISSYNTYLGNGLNNTSNSWHEFSNTLNLHQDIQANGIRAYSLQLTKVGGAGNLLGNLECRYREAR